MILAAEALARDAETIAISVDGTPRKGSLYRTFRPATLERGPVTLANTGAAAAQVVVNVTGNPTSFEPAAANGYAIERTYYKLDGTQVDPAQVRQNDRLVTVLKVTEAAARTARVLLVDRLPADRAMTLLHAFAASGLGPLVKLLAELFVSIQLFVYCHLFVY